MDIVVKHCINKEDSVKEALFRLNNNAPDSILFVVDEQRKLIGSLTDGDLRRGFLKNLDFEDSLLSFIKNNPLSIQLNNYTLTQLQDYKERDFKIIPIVDDENRIVDILNFRHQSTIIPADAVLMAGGKGKRLMPLTQDIPKPLLKVGDKPIIEYNIDRFIQVGIKNIKISVNYLGDQLIDYFGDGSNKGSNISYVRESQPLGTIGSILLFKDFKFEDIVVMNSDILTNIDLADFYKTFKDSDADMAIAATSYHVDVPYAVLEVDSQNTIQSLKEKPRYTYYSNAGIYILKRELLKLIPANQFYDITDLMEDILTKGKKLITYPITGYWLDIGRHEDYKKAQEDIKHIKI
mgnify:CR=1 FL=1